MGSDKIITINNNSQWKKLVLRKNSRHPRVVVDFVASWCPPCRMMAPTVEELRKAYPNVCFVKVDVDQNRGIASGCGIQQMPTFQFYFEGELVNSLLGASKERLEAIIRELSDMESTEQPEECAEASPSCFGGFFKSKFGSLRRRGSAK